jgi:hypothetical protein
VYQRFFDGKKCRTIPSNGRLNAVVATITLNSEGFLGFLTIVDADFDRLDSITPRAVNILYTDSHDLETMLLNSTALDRVLPELLSPRRKDISQSTILQLALQAGAPIGILRWVSSPAKQNLGLKFKGVDFRRFVAFPSFVSNIDAMIQEVLRNTGACVIDIGRLKTSYYAIDGRSIDLWDVCSGHDLVELIFIGLKDRFGNRRAKSTTLEVFDAMVRIAYSESDFRSTKLFQQIQTWESSNSTYKILN